MKREKTHKSVFKFFPPWSFEQEEQWLNAMAMQGWALCQKFRSFYRFERTEPDEYTIRMVMHEREYDYIHFVEQSGAEYLGGSGTAWMYFRRKSALGDFRLLPDLDAKIEHLNKLARTFAFNATFLLLAHLYMMISTISSGIRTNQPEHLIIIFIVLWALFIAPDVLSIYGLGRVHGKREELKKERSLHE